MRKRFRRGAAVVAVASAAALVMSGCSGGSGGGEGEITITLSGPNQWNNDPQSFGPAWEEMIERFEEAEPEINVETNVLPIPTFGDTLSTQLTAGTAPELVFNQAPHSPDQVVALDDYLEEPNEYIDGNERWIDAFDQQYYADWSGARNAAGSFEWVPLNLVIVGVYFNQEIMDEAGVETPIATFGDMLDACEAITDAGYTPFAMDDGSLGQGWTASTIYKMLTSKYSEELNQFGPDGEPGTADQLTGKSVAKALFEGDLLPTSTPEIAESMRILKSFFDECATENWSGIPGGAAFIGYDEFISGQAAMSFGTNFAANNLQEVDWDYGTMPLFTVTEEDSDLSTGVPARFGAAPGGTSYMIPATTEGEQLEAAVKFLKFVTSPDGNQAWLDESGGIPASVDGVAAPGLEGLMAGDWFDTPLMPDISFPKAKAGQPLFTGYLLGSRSLDEQLATMEADQIQAAKEQAADGGWTEDWVAQ